MVIIDCGKCKNCKDKRKFGGPGIKKKACCDKENKRTNKKTNKKTNILYIISKLATLLITIDNYDNNISNNISNNIDINAFDSLLMLTNIIDFDQTFIKNI